MVTLGLFCLKAPITCSLYGCWNVEPEPFSVAEPPCAGALAPATATPDVARPATRATGSSHRRLATMRFIESCPPRKFRGGRYEAMLARPWRRGGRTVNTAGTIGGPGPGLADKLRRRSR